ncbi:MAG: hypothetical protein AB7T37_12520 [Dehalococcoidia bacterium]
MSPTETLAKATTPDGCILELRRHDGDYVLRADGYDLMISRAHGSEDAMMRLACDSPKPGMRVLVGGLGMGYTARAALDFVPEDAQVVVAELVEAVVAWNREYLGVLAGNPLDDPRTALVVDDVRRVILAGEGQFDAILLDVDNGPHAPTQPNNSWLYTPGGLAAIKRALRRNGAVAVWSVEEHPAFLHRLRAAGFNASCERVTSHHTRHSVFVGRRR